jgi:hypothetical protein
VTEELDTAFKRWYANGGREDAIAAGVLPDDKPAGRTDRQTLELPSERHRELLALLRANSHRDGAGRLVSRWSQEQLAAKLHVCVRTLRNVLADLREPGSDPRHPTSKAVGLRLGLLKVEPTRRDPPVGGRVFATNLYIIVESLPVGASRNDGNGPPLPVGVSRDDAQTRSSHRQAKREEAGSQGEPTGNDETAGRTDRQTQNRRSHRRATKKPALTSGNDNGVACLELEPKAQTITLSTVGVEPVAGPARARELAAAPALERIRLDPDTGFCLDRDPTGSEVRATLERGFGPVQVLGVVANDDPDAEAKLDQLGDGSAGLPDGWSWRRQWSAEPVGRCRRCRRASHTAGPDGEPWHAFCWGNLVPPPRAARRKRKGRRRAGAA